MAPRQNTMAAVLPTHTAALFDAAVTQAVQLLRRGEVVALPTETVYGLAANALDPMAVARIYEIKGRPAHNPIIVHVASHDMARACAAHWPDAAARLAAGFWPGPLTLVLDRAPTIPDIVTAGGNTVGVRWPSHPFIQAVIRACGFPLAAPSANLSNQVSPTNPGHVAKSLGDRVPLIVDGGQSQVGIESTVVDVTVHPPRILRPGMIHLESIVAATGGEPAAIDGAKGPALRSPGMLDKHYSPRARLLIWSWAGDHDLRGQLSTARLDLSGCHVIAHSTIPSAEALGSVSVIPHDAEAYARAIYAELHRCDDEGAKTIIVEAVPESAEWRGISDRLRRAAN